MTDKATKLLLAAIAVGLWANIIAPTARAQQPFGMGNDPLVVIARDLSAIADGRCTNHVLCGDPNALMRR